MITEPHQRCITCRLVRLCARHRRAACPPAAAKDWLKRHCRRATPEKRYCAFVYQDGTPLPPTEDATA